MQVCASMLNSDYHGVIMLTHRLHTEPCSLDLKFLTYCISLIRHRTRIVDAQSEALSEINTALE